MLLPNRKDSTVIKLVFISLAVSLSAQATPLESCLRWLASGNLPAARDLVTPQEYRDLAFQLSSALEKTADERMQLSNMLPANRHDIFQDESSQGYHLTHQLIPLRPYRTLLELVDWESTVHFQRHENFSHTSIFNALLGRPRNIEDDIDVGLVITQVANSSQVRLSFALGPYSSTALDHLLPEMRKAFGDRVEIDSQRRFVLREFPLTRNSSDFMRRLIHGLQDRRFARE